MSDQGSSRPSYRLARKAGRFLLLALLLVAAVPVWMLLTAGVAVLHLVRPWVTIPLGLVATGGAFVAIYFAWVGDWPSAGSAAISSAICGTLLVTFTALGEWTDPDFGKATKLPPWWWSV